MTVLALLALAPAALAEPFDADRPATWRGTWVTVRGEKLTITGGTFWDLQWEAEGETAGVDFKNVKKTRREIRAEVVGPFSTPIRIHALEDGTGLWIDSNLATGFVSQRLYPLEGIEGLDTRPEPDLWGTWFGPFWDTPWSVAFGQLPKAWSWAFQQVGGRGECKGEVLLEPSGETRVERRCDGGTVDSPELVVVDADTLRWDGMEARRSLEASFHPGRLVGPDAKVEGAERGGAGERVRVDQSFSVVVPEGFTGHATADRVVLRRGGLQVEVLAGPFVDPEGFRVAWKNLSGQDADPVRLPGRWGLLAAGEGSPRLYAVPVDRDGGLFLVFTGEVGEDADALAEALAASAQVRRPG